MRTSHGFLRFQMCTLLALAMLYASSTSAADVVRVVPSQFVGEWNSNLKDCGTDLNDSALKIKPTSIAFYESDGPLKAIVVHGHYEIAMIAELSGEGETWLSTIQFKLSQSEDELISTNIPGEKFVRYRCPTVAK